MGKAVFHQAWNRCLIAAGNATIRARLEIVRMYLFDQLRCIHQCARRPEATVQVCAHLLQRRGHRSVNNHLSVFFQ